jgi:hypothetical protein
MVMKELHEGPSGGHFATQIMQRTILNARNWWQLCIGTCMIIAYLIMHVKEHEDWQLKVLESWS